MPARAGSAEGCPLLGDAGLEGCGGWEKPPSPPSSLPFLPGSGLLPLPPLAKPNQNSAATGAWVMWVTLLGDDENRANHGSQAGGGGGAYDKK